MEFFGHLHPLLVHLPIGFLLLALLFHMLIHWAKQENLKQALTITLVAGMIAALFSCITGYVLSLSGDYDKELTGKHQNLGLLTTAISLGWFYAHSTQQKIIYQHLSAGLVLLGISITGHLGGTLTHGEGYLFSGAGSAEAAVQKPVINDIAQAKVYADLVAPLLQEKCYSCHGASKQKGKLRMDKPEFLLKGGENGVILKAGNWENSEMIKRILLPKQHEDHMPPKEKGQLSENEIALLKWWVQSGTSFDKTVTQSNPDEKTLALLKQWQHKETAESEEMSLPAAEAKAPDQRTLDTLKKRGVMVIPIARASSYFLVNYISTDTLLATDLSLLLALKENIVWLKMSGQPVNDEGLKIIGQLSQLRKLQIDHTNISDSGLIALKDLKELSHLNVVGTRISAKGVESLRELQKLKMLYLHGSSVKGSDIASLQKIFPKTSIDSGGRTLPFLESDTQRVKPK